MSSKLILIVALTLVFGWTAELVQGQENQIVNSEFDDGLNGWGIYGATGFDVSVVQNAGLSGTNAVLLDVTNAAATTSIGIAQNLAGGLVQGQTYPIGFTAKAEQEREMVVLIQLYKPEGPEWIDLWQPRVQLTKTPQTFTLEYEHTTETTTTNPDWSVDIYYMLKGAYWSMTGSDLNKKVWLDRIYFGEEPAAPRRDLATNPDPADTATDVWRDTALAWTPGAFAQTHDVYFGTSLDDVNAATRSNPMDVLVSQGQAAETYDPGRLEFDQTYYWRIDEVNAPPDSAVIRGTVWSFTTEPFVYPIETITATSNAISAEGKGPENTINGSGLNADDQHSTSSNDMWLGQAPAGESVWIQYEFDRIYQLHEMLVWNYNEEFERVLGFGLKDVMVEYSADGVDWSVLGDVEFAQATSKATYTYNTTVDFGGVAAKFVRLTVNSGWGMLGQYGLSEVRFLYIPAQATQPQPADEATDVDAATALAWRPGREAATHEVYLGTDPETLAVAATPDTATFTPERSDLRSDVLLEGR